MNFKKIYIYILVALVLFQDTFFKITGLNFINYLDELITVILFIIAIFCIIKNKRVNKISLIICALIIIFSIVGIYSCYCNSIFIFKDVLFSNFLSIKIFIIIISLCNIEFKENTIRYFIGSVLFYGKLVAIFASLNFIFPVFYNKIFNFTILDKRFGFYSVCSLFIHPGIYGWFMLFISLYYYSRFTLTNNLNFLKKFAFYIIFALLSFKVKVILGIVSILIFDVFVRNKKRIKLNKILTVIMIAFIILFLAKDLLINTYYMYFTKTFGESARMSLTVNSIKIMKDYFPIGVGFGKFASWFARIHYSEYYYIYNMNSVYGLNPINPGFATDTYWPSIFGETGIIGTSIILIIFIIIYKEIRKKTYYIKQKYNYIYIWAILVIIQSFIESTSEAIYNSSPQYIFIGVLTGISLGVTLKEDKK